MLQYPRRRLGQADVVGLPGCQVQPAATLTQGLITGQVAETDPPGLDHAAEGGAGSIGQQQGGGQRLRGQCFPLKQRPTGCDGNNEGVTPGVVTGPSSHPFAQQPPPFARLLGKAPQQPGFGRRGTKRLQPVEPISHRPLHRRIKAALNPPKPPAA